MDFHGNNVHHIGYGHPRLIEAINRPMQELSFAPRHYACEVAAQLSKRLIFKTTMGNVLTFTPSLITTCADIDYARKVIDESPGEAERELGYA